MKRFPRDNKRHRAGLAAVGSVFWPAHALFRSTQDPDGRTHRGLVVSALWNGFLSQDGSGQTKSGRSPSQTGRPSSGLGTPVAGS